MADPMAMVSLAGSAAGGVLGAIGAANTGAANASMYQYKAGVALINQKIATQNSQWALQAGGTQAEEKGLQGAQSIAETKVRQAAGDIDVNSGSAAATRDSMVKASQFDQQVIAWDAQKQAYGYATKAAEAGAEATMDTQAASQAKTAGWLGALSSVIGGATSVASKWTQAGQIGLMTNNSGNASTANAAGGGSFDTTGSLY